MTLGYTKNVKQTNFPICLFSSYLKIGSFLLTSISTGEGGRVDAQLF